MHYTTLHYTTLHYTTPFCADLHQFTLLFTERILRTRTDGAMQVYGRRAGIQTVSPSHPAFSAPSSFSSLPSNYTVSLGFFFKSPQYLLSSNSLSLALPQHSLSHPSPLSTSYFFYLRFCLYLLISSTFYFSFSFPFLQICGCSIYCTFIETDILYRQTDKQEIRLKCLFPLFSFLLSYDVM